MKLLTVGYVADRFQGNTGGVGAAFGLLRVAGIPLPALYRAAVALSNDKSATRCDCQVMLPARGAGGARVVAQERSEVRRQERGPDAWLQLVSEDARTLETGGYVALVSRMTHCAARSHSCRITLRR